jgi:hypothetical protein
VLFILLGLAHKLVKDLELAGKVEHRDFLIHHDIFCSHAAASTKLFFIVVVYIRFYNEYLQTNTSISQNIFLHYPEKPVVVK